MLEELQAALGPEVLAIIGVSVAAVIAYLRGDMARALSSVIDVETQLRNLLSEEFASVVPSSTEVSQEDIEAAVSDQYGEAAAEDILFLDGRYFSTDSEGFDSMDRLDVIEYLPYRPARFDCENFADLFKTTSALIFGVNTVGVVIDWSGGHAYNIVYLEDGSVFLYEPQTGDRPEVGDALGDDESYTMDNVDIFF
jgi:hypothetical protein